MTQDRSRTPAEWVTFGVSLVVLAIFIGLVTRELSFAFQVDPAAGELVVRVTG